MDKLKTLSDIATQHPFLVGGVMLVLVGAMGLVPLGNHPYAIRSPWQWILLAIGLVLVITDVVRFFRSSTPAQQSLAGVNGAINRPTNNDTVPTVIDTEGWVSNLEKDQHLWLIIEVGNQKWPKAGEIQTAKNGSWQRRVFEDGTASVFSLSLFVADNDGHQMIQAWLDIGPLIAYRPFELDIPGTRRLARTNLHVSPDRAAEKR